jgi:hypothetical protein
MIDLERISRAALPALLLSACAAPTVAVEPRWTMVDVEGDVAVASGNVTATNDVDAVGIEEDDGAFGARADFKWGAPHLTLDLQQSRHDGDGVLEAELSQGGVTLAAGTPVETDLDLGLHTAYLTFDLLPGDFELGLGLGVAAVDLDFESTDPATGTSVATDELLPVPLLAGRAGVGLGPVDLEALVGGMAYDDGEVDVTVVDGRATGRLRILGSGDRLSGALVGGVRYTSIDAEYEDGSDEVAGDLEILGPFLGLRVQF